MKTRLAFLVLLLSCVTAPAQVANPAVTQANLATTVCTPGWTKTVRPSTRYTNRVKLALLDKYGIPRARASSYELDHRMPLAVGGHPTDPKNLALQTWGGPRGAHKKDIVETRVHRELCAGEITLRQAQACWAKDWTKCP